MSGLLDVKKTECNLSYVQKCYKQGMQIHTHQNSCLSLLLLTVSLATV